MIKITIATLALVAAMAPGGAALAQRSSPRVHPPAAQVQPPAQGRGSAPVIVAPTGPVRAVRPPVVTPLPLGVHLEETAQPLVLTLLPSLDGWTPRTAWPVSGPPSVVYGRNGWWVIVRRLDGRLYAAPQSYAAPPDSAWTDLGVATDAEPDCAGGGVVASGDLSDFYCAWRGPGGSAVIGFFRVDQGTVSITELGGAGGGPRPTVVTGGRWYFHHWEDGVSISYKAYTLYVWNGGAGMFRRDRATFVNGQTKVETPSPGYPSAWSQLTGQFSSPFDCNRIDSLDTCAAVRPDGTIGLFNMQDLDAPFAIRVEPALLAATLPVPGGATHGSPALLLTPNQTVIVIAASASGVLYAARRTGESFTPWRAVGGAARADTSVRCESPSNNFASCTIQGLDGLGYRREIDGLNTL